MTRTVGKNPALAAPYGNQAGRRVVAIIGHGSGLGVLAALLSKGETLDAIVERSEGASLKDADFAEIERRTLAHYQGGFDLPTLADPQMIRE